MYIQDHSFKGTEFFLNVNPLSVVVVVSRSDSGNGYSTVTRRTAVTFACNCLFIERRPDVIQTNR